MSDAAQTESAEPTATPEESTAAPKKPFALSKGNRVRYGNLEGKVTVLRGNGEVPYEVCIVWSSEKYPQWYQYGALALAYDRGEFQVG